MLSLSIMIKEAGALIPSFGITHTHLPGHTMLATGLSGPTASWTGELKIQRLQKTSPNNDRESFEHLSWVEHGWNPHVITSDLSWKPSARSTLWDPQRIEQSTTPVGGSHDSYLKLISMLTVSPCKSPKYEVGLSHINHLVLTTPCGFTALSEVMRYPYITYITYITGFCLCQNIPVTHFTAELLGGSSHESCNDPWVRKFPVSHPDYWLLADLLTRSNHLRPVKWTNIWCLIICESYFPTISHIFIYFPLFSPH